MRADPGFGNLKQSRPMISLGRLMTSIGVSKLEGIADSRQPVRGLTCDSRELKPGYVFVALKGEKLNGHKFVQEAAERKCLAVVVEEGEKLPENSPCIKVADSHFAYGCLAAEYFGHPARTMKVIGITGTNGKTTTSWMIEQVIRSNGGRPGVIGTINYRYVKEDGQTVELDAPLTTPGPMLLQGLLREMSDEGVTHAILEVSSHSLAQKRLAGMLFDVAVFTNLSRDHLDYHGNMVEYFNAKQKLFDEYLKENAVAVVGMEQVLEGCTADKDWGRTLSNHLSSSGFENYPAQVENKSVMTFGFDNDCSVRAGKVHQDIDGIECNFSLGDKRFPVKSGLIGFHNISNMLGAAATGVALGMEPGTIVKGLQEVRCIPGRLERIGMPGITLGADRPRVFVDYAHTPDALQNVLQTLRPVTRGRLFCVFGCGGDRDQGKRPLMGAVAASLADAVMITSDNPRSESPEAIMSEIEGGVQGNGLRRVGLDALFDLDSQGKGYALLEDRKEAIHQVCSRAKSEDVVLIAGKGHETYQITSTGRRYFDDRTEARNSVLRWNMDHLLLATGGQVKQKGESELFNNISTDTRTIKPGDIFVALRGDNFDGHDYLQEAVNKGAAAVIVDKTCSGLQEHVCIIEVADTLQALGNTARYRRSLLGSEAPVIGITGSSGKTTVKEITAAIFEVEFENNQGCPVLKTQGNLNNLIGLPLSLLQIDAGHRVAVMEMGMNRPGEIDRLARISAPDIGCITNVQGAHLEGLGTIEGVARAKGELFAAMPEKSIRVVNYDDHHVRKLGGRYGDNVIGFAVTPVGRRFNPAVRATRIVSLGENGMRFTLHVNKWQQRITVPATGEHNVANCAAAAAIATAAGVKPETVIRGLIRYRSGDKRLQIVETPGKINVVNDSYNANPASMAAALKTVAGFGKECRRIALLGDMFELGSGAESAHQEIGRLVADLGYDYLGVIGGFAQTVLHGACESGMKRSRVRQFLEKEDMAEWVSKLVGEKKISRGDWVLIKGSRGMQMERVLQSMNHLLQSDNN